MAVMAMVHVMKAAEHVSQQATKKGLEDANGRPEFLTPFAIQSLRGADPSAARMSRQWSEFDSNIDRNHTKLDI